MSDEKDGIVDLGQIRRLSTYIQGRNDVDVLMAGLSELTTAMETILIQEKYGVSVVFHEDKMIWEAYDPVHRYVKYGSTPMAAVILWDAERLKFEEKKRPRSTED